MCLSGWGSKDGGSILVHIALFTSLIQRGTWHDMRNCFSCQSATGWDKRKGLWGWTWWRRGSYLSCLGSAVWQLWLTIKRGCVSRLWREFLQCKEKAAYFYSLTLFLGLEKKAKCGERQSRSQSPRYRWTRVMRALVTRLSQRNKQTKKILALFELID